MSEPDLKCGAYEGRCFGTPDEDEAVCIVGGERMFEVELIVVDDFDVSYAVEFPLGR